MSIDFLQSAFEEDNGHKIPHLFITDVLSPQFHPI